MYGANQFRACPAGVVLCKETTRISNLKHKQFFLATGAIKCNWSGDLLGLSKTLSPVCNRMTFL